MYCRELNNANAAKRMTDFLGHSNNFATLSYICANRQSTTFINIRARASIYGFSCVHAREVGLFFVPVEQLRRGRRQREGITII